MEAMTAAELTDKPGLLNLKDKRRFIQSAYATTRSNSNKLILNTSMSANIFPAEIDGNLAKWNEGHKEQAATRRNW